MKEGSAMTEILAIDDDREILAVIKKALLREGYQVTALEDPLQLEEDGFDCPHSTRRMGHG